MPAWHGRPPWGVDAAVDPVGVEPDGQMTLPADVDRVGWYRFGPAPGDDGSAVIAGHVDDREQGLGALAPLRDAAVGDEVVGHRRGRDDDPLAGRLPGADRRSRCCPSTGCSPATDRRG